MSLACFDTLVGLSKVTYDCFTDTQPTGYDDSDSGYHLTDTDFGLTVIDQCEVEGWTLLQSALQQAILETKSDLRAKLRERFDGGLSPYSGVIAQLAKTGTLSVSNDYLGQRYRTVQQKGMKWVIKKIYIGVNTSGDYTVEITSNDPLFVSPAPVVVTAVANQFSVLTLDTPIELPLFSRACTDRYIDYYISFDRDGALPLNNKITCCGAKPGWMKHLTVSGFAAQDNEGTGAGYSSLGHGLAIDGYMACEELDWICELEELNGYYLKDVVARCIQQRGAAIAISALIDTQQVSPCTGYQIENLNSRRAYLNQRYADNINWIAQNMPTGVTDCFKCKPANMFHRSKQLV